MGIFDNIHQHAADLREFRLETRYDEWTNLFHVLWEIHEDGSETLIGGDNGEDLVVGAMEAGDWLTNYSEVGNVCYLGSLIPIRKDYLDRMEAINSPDIYEG